MLRRLALVCVLGLVPLPGGAIASPSRGKESSEGATVAKRPRDVSRSHRLRKRNRKRPQARTARRQRKARKARRQRKARRARRSRARRARARRRGQLNMPRGWSWPPNRAMRRAGASCLRDLRKLGVAYRRAPRTRRVVTPIYLIRMQLGTLRLSSVWRRGPFVMDCHLARALARHSSIFAKHGIVEVRFTQIHKYRVVTVNGKTKRNILSRHALGLAMDVPTFVTQDGTRLQVLRDYATSPVLQALERDIGALPDFRRVITPRLDPKSHDDHFHFAARMRLR